MRLAAYSPSPMSNAVDTMVQLVVSATVDGYTKKRELEKLLRWLQDEADDEGVSRRASELVQVLVGQAEREGDDAELRGLAVRCLAALVSRRRLSLTGVSQMRARKCLLKLLREALGVVGNLKDDPLKNAYASAVHLLGSKADEFGLEAAEVSDACALYGKTADGGSVSIRKECALLVMRMLANDRFRQLVEETASVWVSVLGKELSRGTEDEKHMKTARSLLSKSRGACFSLEQAKVMERYALEGLDLSTPTTLVSLELVCLVTGKFFLQLLAENNHSWRLLLSALDHDMSRSRGWAIWCQACTQSLPTDGSPLSAEQLQRMMSLFANYAFISNASIVAALQALTNTSIKGGGLWDTLIRCHLSSDLLSKEVSLVVGRFVTHASKVPASLELAIEVWAKLINRLLLDDGKIPRTLFDAHYHNFCQWAFVGVSSIAVRNAAADEQGALADLVRAFTSGLLGSIRALLLDSRVGMDAKRAVLRVWVDCKRDDGNSKVLSMTGLEAMRKVISSDSLNSHCDRPTFYKVVEEMVLQPTAVMLLEHYDLVDAVMTSGAVPASQQASLKASALPMLKLPAQLALMLVRCRAMHLASVDPLSSSILVDFSALIKRIEAAAHLDFVLQMSRLARHVQDDANLNSSLAGVVFGLRVWTIVTDQCGVRVERLAVEARSDLCPVPLLAGFVISTLGSICKTVDGAPLAALQAQTDSWRLALSEAGEVWKRMVLLLADEHVDISDLVLVLSGVVEEGFKSLAVKAMAWRGAMAPFTEDICRLLCRHVCPTLQPLLQSPSAKMTKEKTSESMSFSGSGAGDAVLKLVLDDSQQSLFRMCSLFSSVSDLLHLESAGKPNEAFLRECCESLMTCAASACKQVSSFSGVEAALRGLQPLLDLWVGSSPDLLNDVLGMITRCCPAAEGGEKNDKIPSLSLMHSWLSKCLVSNRQRIFHPSMDFWNNFLVHKKVAWTSEWLGLMHELREVNESVFMVPSGVDLPLSDSAAGTVGSGAAVAAAAKKGSTPSLHFDEDDEDDDGSPSKRLPPTQAVGDDDEDVRMQKKRQLNADAEDEMVPPTLVLPPTQEVVASPLKRGRAELFVRPEIDVQLHLDDEGDLFSAPPPAQVMNSYNNNINNNNSIEMVLDAFEKMGHEEQVALVQDLMRRMRHDGVMRVFGELLKRAQN